VITDNPGSHPRFPAWNIHWDRLFPKEQSQVAALAPAMTIISIGADNEITRRPIVPPRPEPDEEPPVDLPWTPDVREPDPDLLPDELPVPNPDENNDPVKRV
jgi:hypothetical protein